MKIISKLKYLLKTLKSFGVSVFSLKVIMCLALEQKQEAVEVVKCQLKVDPSNWRLYRFLLEHYKTDHNSQILFQLLEQFVLSYYATSLLQCDIGEYESAIQSCIDAFLISSREKHDFCEIDFLEGAWPPSFSLHIVVAGRFSNFLIQLSNAISIATLFNIRDIYITPSSSILSLFPDLSPVLCTNSNVKLHFAVPSSGLVIRGFFFHVCRQLGPFIYASSSLRETVSSFRHATFFPQSISRSPNLSQDTSDKSLVIHLRSGDIFSSKCVHADYGQPPLSYYIVSIEHYRPTSVTLVYEDTLNPVIAKLIDYLVASNIPYIIQSSTLLADLDVLSKASAIVISRGTFASGILCINDKLRTVYCFNSGAEDDAIMKLQTLNHFYGKQGSTLSPVMFEVIDEIGFYFDKICSGNWINSTFQRRLMLSYPSRNLAIKQIH